MIDSEAPQSDLMARPFTDPTGLAVPIPVELDCAGRSDIGRKRETNQDQFLIADLHKNMHVQCSSMPLPDKELFGDVMGKLLFVADGMGGALAGEVASEMAIQSMARYLLNNMHWLFHPTSTDVESFIEDLKSGARFSHQAVFQNAEQNPEHSGMGTTLTLAYLIWPMLYVLHVGDSRCYVLRDGSIQLLTKDQTLAQQLRDLGRLDDGEFESSPYHHVLYSAIGSKSGPETVVYKTRLLAGDRVLLASDGVNAHLNDVDIEQILAADLSADEICQQFIDTANERGGNDNITAVVTVSNQKCNSTLCD